MTFNNNDNPLYQCEYSLVVSFGFCKRNNVVPVLVPVHGKIKKKNKRVEKKKKKSVETK